MLYFGLNFAFLVLLVIGAAVGAGDNPRWLYLALLFALCSTPVLYAGPLNGPHAVLCIYLALYFEYYGAADLVGLLTPTQLTTATGLLSAPEAAILVGIALLISGYVIAIGLAKRRATQSAVKDWSGAATVTIGLAFIALGIAATWIWRADEQFILAGTSAARLGQLATIGVLISTYVHPLGVALLAYQFATSRSRRMAMLVLAVLLVEVVLGFFGGSKELAVRAIVLILLAWYLVHGRVAKTWLIAAAAVTIVVFPLMQTYRNLLMTHGVTTFAAASDMLKWMGETFDSWKDHKNDQRTTAVSTYGSLSFVQRSALKPTLELIMGHAGKDVPYQNGYTMALTLTGFVPRIIWPDKPDSSTGHLFNKEFSVSEDLTTYISSTHLGELYWNYGWFGIISGMPLIGMLLGYVNSRCVLTARRSVSRLLVFVATIYCLCFRIEGGLALWYIQWIRTLAVIGLLQLALARSRPSRTVEPGASDPVTNSNLYFPNLLR